MSEVLDKLTTCVWTSQNVLWVENFKGVDIRIEQDNEYNEGKLMITVHKPDEDYHAKLLVKETT